MSATTEDTGKPDHITYPSLDVCLAAIYSAKLVMSFTSVGPLRFFCHCYLWSLLQFYDVYDLQN